MGSLAWAEPTRLTSIGRYASPTWVPLSLLAPLPRTKSVFHLSSSLRHLSSAASCSQAGDSLASASLHSFGCLFSAWRSADPERK